MFPAPYFPAPYFPRGFFPDESGAAPVRILTAQAGMFGVYNQITGPAQVGAFRVQNAIEGWTVRLGVNQLPDESADPDAFSAVLPFNIVLTPPVSGTTTYYVLVRKRNLYGLESQNHTVKTFTLNSSGILVFPILQAPQGLLLKARPSGVIRVLASYVGFGSDVYPANVWRVWIGTGAIDTAVDVPTYTVPASRNLAAEVGFFATNLDYNVVVGLFRNVDGVLSEVVEGVVSLKDPPAEPTPVPGGFEIE